MMQLYNYTTIVCLSFDLCPQEAENEYDKWANQGEQEESYDDYQYGGGYGTCLVLLLVACRDICGDVV